METKWVGHTRLQLQEPIFFKKSVLQLDTNIWFPIDLNFYVTIVLNELYNVNEINHRHERKMESEQAKPHAVQFYPKRQKSCYLPKKVPLHYSNLENK